MALKRNGKGRNLGKMSGRTNSKTEKIHTRRIFLRIILVVFLIPLWIYLRGVYRARVGSFGCFDDCFNYMGGYFLLSGKRLYSEIFFNHQPLMAYISYLVQRLFHPGSIYALVSTHRLILIVLSIAADILLTLRFGLVGFAFSLLYEGTKGFIFGERFLAEGIIVYPVVYLWGLVWSMLRVRRIPAVELVLAGIFCWFIAFIREPFVPLALAFLGAMTWPNRKRRAAWVACGIFVVLSSITVLTHPIADYWFNVVTVNQLTVGGAEVQRGSLLGTGVLRIFFYPVYLFFGGQWNLFRHIEVGLSVSFFVLLVAQVLVKRRWKTLGVVILFLGLANLRPVDLGYLYFGAFHGLPWFALFIAVTLFFLKDAATEKGKHWLAAIMGVAFILLTGYAYVNPSSYLHDRVDRATEFTTNYAGYYATGETIRLLSTPNDTLFLDGYDDLIYWQAQRFSSYRYSWYTSVAPGIDRYKNARADMFRDHPPEFYYGVCVKDVFDPASVPYGRAVEYVRLTAYGRPTCLFIQKNKLLTITKDQWASVVRFGFEPPAVVQSHQAARPPQ